MAIAPLNGYLLIRPHESKSKTKSGLITDTSDKKIEVATVIAADSAVKEIVDGQEILFKSFNTDELRLDGEVHVFIKSEDVLAVKN